MVVRAGYGMFYNESIYTQLLSELANQPPWSTSQLRIAGANDVLTLQNGFPGHRRGTKHHTKYVCRESELQSGIRADLESFGGNRTSPITPRWC